MNLIWDKKKGGMASKVTPKIWTWTRSLCRHLAKMQQTAREVDFRDFSLAWCQH